jgi:hypothetical protein
LASSVAIAPDMGVVVGSATGAERQRMGQVNYILDPQGRPAPEPDLLKWAAWMAGLISVSSLVFWFSFVCHLVALILSFPRTPAAASGAGFGGAQPPSNWFVLLRAAVGRRPTR